MNDLEIGHIILMLIGIIGITYYVFRFRFILVILGIFMMIYGFTETSMYLDLCDYIVKKYGAK